MVRPVLSTSSQQVGNKETSLLVFEISAAAERVLDDCVDGKKSGGKRGGAIKDFSMLTHSFAIPTIGLLLRCLEKGEYLMVGDSMPCSLGFWGIH